MEIEQRKRNRKRKKIHKEYIANRKKIPPLDFEMHSSYFLRRQAILDEN